MGSSFPENPEIIPTLNCEVESKNPILAEGSIFLLTGHTAKIFGDNEDFSTQIRIRFPLRAIGADFNSIDFNDDTLNDIRIIDDNPASMNRGRNLLGEITFGIKYMLVIRVNGWSEGQRQIVSQTQKQLLHDIFHWGNNNLVSVSRLIDVVYLCLSCVYQMGYSNLSINMKKTLYRSCSAGKLLFKPATAPQKINGVKIKGVIDVELPKDFDICAMDHITAGNVALKNEIVTGFYLTPGRKVTNKVSFHHFLLETEGVPRRRILCCLRL